MNQFKFLVVLIILLFSTNMFSQHNELNYPSELPFQTQNDSEYYHLESSLLIRTIVKDIVEVLEKVKVKNESQSFRILFQNSNGAQLPINYTVDVEKITSVMASDSGKSAFMVETYDWINRSFRSNIPFED